MARHYTEARLLAILAPLDRLVRINTTLAVDRHRVHMVSHLSTTINHQITVLH